MLIKGTTKLLGVMGYPVEHSLSPAMHNAALERSGLDYAYVPLLIHPNQLAAALDGLTALNWVGCSVTIPHKQTIMAYLEAVTPVARAIGAVNTIWRTATGWQGTNTDMVGFLAPLQPLVRDWAGTAVVILGSGGAARAVVAACQSLNCGTITVVGRDPAKLAAFGASWSEPVALAAWHELDPLLATAGLVVNCTPIGMAPQAGLSPLKPAQVARLPQGAIVYDLIYSPRPTELLKISAAAGYGAIDGSDMLVFQGAAAWHHWLDLSAPVDVMREALLNHLATKQS
jgi:shikimate dehydrogenase